MQEDRAKKTKQEAAQLKRKAKEEEQAVRIKAQRVEQERSLVKALQAQDFAVPSYWTEQDVTNVAAANVMQPSGWAKHKFIIPLVKGTVMSNHGPGCNHLANPLQPLATGRPACGAPERIYVTSVHRLENVQLWRKYCRARHTIVERAQRCSSGSILTPLLPEPITMRTLRTMDIIDKFGLDPAANECFLWHGTQPGHVEPIVSAGFDERVSSEGGLYGRGVYFAESGLFPHPIFPDVHRTCRTRYAFSHPSSDLVTRTAQTPANQPSTATRRMRTVITLSSFAASRLEIITRRPRRCWAKHAPLSRTKAQASRTTPS